MLKIAGMLKKRGWSREEIAQAVIAFNALHGRPDKDGREVDRVTARVAVTAVSCPYSASAAGIIWRRYKDDKPIDQPLTNFAATIVAEIERDDGAERSLHFEIEAEMEGRRHRFEIGAAEFAGLGWATRELGAKALVYPGATVKDHARCAIQMLSPSDMPRRRLFGHLGWRDLGGKQVYLHAGGAIDASGLRTDIETDLGDLALFELPAPSDPKASLQLLDLGPLAITAPIFATIWRAPIDAADFTLHLAGPTGVFKTELAALAQQHFGPELDARHLAGWSSTANSLEVRAFAAKDSLLVVDDFAPGGAASDVQRMQREAARLIRAQGNRSGRGRLRPDGTLRPTKPPRCTIISTGEDTPAGQSIRARLLVVEIGDGDVELVAPDCDAARIQASSPAACPPTSSIWRAIWLGTSAVSGIAPPSCAAMPRAATGARPGSRASSAPRSRPTCRFVDRMDLWPSCWAALLASANAQAAHQLAEDPARRFVALIGALLSSKTAHLARADDPDRTPADHIAGEVGWLQVVPERPDLTSGGEDDKPAIWRPQGPQIGWFDEHKDAAYLEPDAAYGAVQRLATSSRAGDRRRGAHAVEAAQRGRVARDARWRSEHLHRVRRRAAADHDRDPARKTLCLI